MWKRAAVEWVSPSAARIQCEAHAAADAQICPPAAENREPDNVTVHAPSGQVFVAEDSDDLQLVMLSEDTGEWIASPFLQLEGHGSSEIAGPAFSPDGTRLYFSSQRGIDGKNGMTFEVTGAF